MLIHKILIANRGEIAVRIIQTCRRLQIKTVAIYSDADRWSKAVQMADEAIHIGSVDLQDSYLNADKIIRAAKKVGAEAIHPGYGFLSEQADFAAKVVAAGLIFIGAPASAMRLMGSKSAAKKTMIKAGVACVPGYQSDDQDKHVLFKAAEKIGFPILIKAVSGGGGKGMKIVHKADEFSKQLESAQREARNAFGDDRVILEKYITRPKHIEVQVFADSHGQVVHLFERDCSTQRRYQKIIEEAPAAGLNEETRQAMCLAAVKATQAIEYQGAGTIEFILDEDGQFYFMEMNTRLQVEHRVTELITGVDLVAWQIKVAQGEKLPLSQDQIKVNGHAIQVRLYAEDPDNDYLPSTGLIETMHLAEFEYGLADSGVCSGDSVSIFYDPMIAKLVAWGENRKGCIENMQSMLNSSYVFGVKTNLSFLSQIIYSCEFANHQIYTNSLDNKELDLKQDLPPAVVAILARKLLTTTNPESAWQQAIGWRLQGHEPMMLSLTRLQETADYQIYFEGESCIVYDQTDEHTYYQPNCEDYCYQHRNQVQVVHDNQRYIMQLPNHEVLTVASDANAIYAPMPGKVIEIRISEGQAVKRGDTLLVMEAMKMELALKAEKDATIKNIQVAANAQVKADELLLELKP